MGEKYVPLSVILPVTSIGVFMTAMDGSIVNIALPTIANALETDINGVSWVAIIYLLTLASFMGLGGSLGDSYGRKRIFQGGMLVFSVGSLFCSLSVNLELLVASRALQAIGAVGIQANGLALVITYIDPKKRGRAIGINTLVVASALSIGPILGGLLTEHFGWPSIFLINLPIGVIGIIAVERTLSETNTKENPVFDFKGVILFALASFGFIAGIKFVLDGRLWTIIFLIVSIISVYLFVDQERGHPNPVLSMKLMKNKQIMFGALAAIFSFMGINAMTILLPFYFQEILMFNQSKIGLYLVVIPLALSVMGPPAGFLAERFDTRKLATSGALLQTIFTVGLGLALIINKEAIPVWQILVTVGLSAAFLSVFSNPNGTRVMNSSEESELSIVSGILNLSRNIGFTLGTSLSTSLFVLFRSSYGSSDLSETGAYVNALGLTFMIFGIFALIGAIFSFARGDEGVLYDSSKNRKHFPQ